MSEAVSKVRVWSRKVPINVKRGIAVGLVLILLSDLLFFGFIGKACTGAENYKVNYKYSQLPGRPKRKLRIAVVTHHSEDAYGYDLRKMTFGNKKAYCKKHGYDMYDAGAIKSIADKIEEAKPKMRNFFFFKYMSLFEILQGGEATGGKQYDWVVWVDADSMFLNFGKRYEDIIDERFDAIVTIGAPDHPQWKDIINAGSFMVRNSEFGHQFLHDILINSQNDCRQFLQEVPAARTPINGWLQICDENSGGYWLSDQGLVQGLFFFKEESYKCHVKKTWFRVMNSEFPWYGDGDLLIHFPGRRNDDRKKIIKAFMKYANFQNGKVNRKHTDLLDTDDAMTSDLVELEEIYDYVNIPCEH